MKRIILPLLLIIFILSSCSDKGFVINGHLKGAEAGSMIYLDRLGAANLEPFDSAEVNADGYFMIEGNIDYPEFFLIRATQESFLTALVEPEENLTIEAYADSLFNPEFVDGSPGTQSMIDFNIRLTTAVKELGQLSEIYNQNLESDKLEEIMADLDIRAQNILSGMNTYTKEYIDDNLTSMVSMVALYQQVSPGAYVLDPMNDLDYFKKVDSSLYSLYPESGAIISLHEQIVGLIESIEAQNPSTSAFGVGDIVPDFTFQDNNGNDVALSSTLGKIVLLDFWAAWCNPCRLENPNLLKAYKKYSPMGFEIFQVSLDKTKEAWLKGIKEDKLDAWTHVSDLLYWNSAIVPLYKLKSIPANYLLDQEGRVIAIDLRGDKLEKALNMLFNQ